MSEKTETAIKELLYKIADDLLIIGHRNSEWTGLGPILEEDISFSSMAQTKTPSFLSRFFASNSRFCIIESHLLCLNVSLIST